MWLLVDGRKTYAAIGGRGFDAARPCLLFLHGAGMDHTAFMLPARWFAWHGWSVLAPDLPGHGLSAGAPLESVDAMATWTLRLIEAAGVGAVALAGHSMGGAIALEVAARIGRRATGLALLGSAASIPVAPALLAAAHENPSAAADMMTAWGHATAARIGRNAVPGVWMTGAARALLNRCAPGVLAVDLAACDAWATGPASAAKVACPALAVLGDQDVMTPPKRGRELAALIVGARVVSIPGCGHMMLQEAPDAVLDALVSHFKTPSLTSARP